MARGMILTAADRDTMKAMHKTGKTTKSELAKQFKVSVSTVGNIVGRANRTTHTTKGKARGKTAARRTGGTRRAATPKMLIIPLSAILVVKGVPCIDLLNFGKFHGG